MLQRNPNRYRSRRAGIIGACAVSGAALATLVVAVGRGAEDEPSRPSPVAVASEADARQQAIEEAAGSDRHLQLLAAELANETEARQQAIEDAARSDRHLEQLAAELAKEAEARQQAIEDEPVRTAIRFIEARDHWDGESVRSLVADDAVIDDFAVATVDDYLANAEFEGIIEWRFLQPQCAATEVGPPAEVTCTYLMQDALSEALDVGPYTGTSIEFVIEDGQIRHVTHHFDYSQYSGQAFEVFTRWLVDAHPGDIDVMLDIADDGSAMRSTTPESLALWAQRIPEFVASLSHS